MKTNSIFVLMSAFLSMTRFSFSVFSPVLFYDFTSDRPWIYSMVSLTT